MPLRKHSLGPQSRHLNSSRRTAYPPRVIGDGEKITDHLFMLKRIDCDVVIGGATLRRLCRRFLKILKAQRKETVGARVTQVSEQVLSIPDLEVSSEPGAPF